MSFEGEIFGVVRNAFEGVFSGDHMPDFDQNAVLDGATEAVDSVIRHFEISAEEIGKFLAMLAALGAVVVSLKFVGGVWKAVVRFG